MAGFTDRENEIFEVLEQFETEGLEFVVVGGYGVSAYQHRFSVDADLVVQEEELEQFEQVLKDKGFEKDTDKDLVYSGRYIAYIKDRELPVTIDLLVNELQCRQTDASWSYQCFQAHSKRREIEGSEKAVTVQVPSRELLIAVKLHSGRQTDARDVVALIEDADLNEVEEHMDRGDPSRFSEVLENIKQTITDTNFEDSFKGVFSQETLPEQHIQKLQDFIEDSTQS